MSYQIYNEDCLEGMKRIPDGAVDCAICDPPLGSTACAWDKTLPANMFMAELLRVVKTNGAVVIFASSAVEFDIVNAARAFFKYKWCWLKNNTSRFILCKYRPLTAHEDILIFSQGTASTSGKKNMIYNPQGLLKVDKFTKNNQKRFGTIVGERACQKKFDYYTREFENYPKDVLRFDSVHTNDKMHTSQKPVDLLEYLIRTYTNEGELVLDATMGSGSTGVAAINTGRDFIGFETEKNFFDIACKRIADAQAKQAQNLFKDVAACSS